MAPIEYLLFEEPTGYAIFKVKLQQDDIGSRLKEVQEQINDFGSFTKLVELVSFAPFKGAAEALENANDVSEGLVSESLKAILDLNLPKGSKGKTVTLAISDKNLGPSIKEEFPYVDCLANELAQDLIRGVRLHGEKLFKGLQSGDLERAQLGLGHAYSRAKVKFSVQKNDNHIIQAIALLDQLDKDINTFAMRVKEWYGWHFPELAKLVPDNYKFAQLVLFIKDKASLNDESLHDLAAILGDDAGIAQRVIDNARISMGQDISETDMENVSIFAQRVVSLVEYRKQLFDYLCEKMHTVAPNLSELIGEVIGARLISHAGSLTNLSKQAASTVQILGAEKALFRALKTKGNTPKYGLIYHSGFIAKASAKNKGRISRYLANKCSMASRIDNYSDEPTNVFGSVLKKQVEQRLEFYNTGKPTLKNELAIQEAMDLYNKEKPETEEKEDKVSSKKRKLEDDEEEKEPKKEKKEKKEKRKRKKKRRRKKRKKKRKRKIRRRIRRRSN
ncbi:snoRNP complex protein NOP56 NDAI_0A01880 [Naumovozyma dairenensis CBS 421]|uniref:Nucleolar protein 56 n=1 Tax=Naumovozyma dairenensis (strain ATCC 10597 / BCRC 20456 / CBS 421 / NBRC 0211 / NRRL Y-12639) TaxID=1071378 RepID=G0W3F8_NAUDC|nr:hypothetical protein NDAI_0A01880 [Naumovozyma dairenensis CBS 421]CCD22346.1 hypothetical protein NDAI_0A01880 [Naumovozyma dairenensis CBS 421]